MPTAAKPSTYIVLGDDGRHVSLTRGGMPTAEDARQMGEALQRKGQGGWIARMDGDYWAPVGRLTMTEVAMIAPTSTAFFDANLAFTALRRLAISFPRSGETAA